MVLLHHKSHLGHRGHHLGTEVGSGIDRWDREVPALGHRTVPDVAALEFLAGVVGPFLRIDPIEGVVHRDVPADVIEDEELSFRPEVRGVTDPGRLEVGLGPDRRRTRVAFVRLTRGGFEDVAKDDEGRLGSERVEHRGRGIRHHAHVGLVDLLPAGDRRAVKHQPIDKHVLVDGVDCLG